MSGGTVVRELIGAIGRFDMARVAELYAADVVQTEHPNRLNPKGQVRGREQLLADLPRGQALLAEQQYDIRQVIEAGDQVVVEASWRGVLKVAIGALQPGDQLEAEIAMVFGLRGGQVVAQSNYDCYKS